MKRIGYYNGEMGEADSLRIPMQDRAMFFGDGVYDFVFACGGKFFALNDHIDRFFNSMRLLEIEPSCTKEELAEKLQMCLDASEIPGQASVYFQTSRGNCARNHIFPPEGTPSTLLITVSPMKKADWDKPLQLTVTEDTRFAHCNIKTLNLIPNVMAAEKAEKAGCGECIFVKDGLVNECAHSALAIIKDGCVIAPPLDHRILPSITRMHVYKLAEKLGIPAFAREITLDEVMGADEVMVLSTSKLMKRADMIDGKPCGMKDAETFLRLRDAYFAWIKEETGYDM